jgi:hypothetical protein
MSNLRLTLGLAGAALLICLPCSAQNATEQPAVTYDDHLLRAKLLFQQGKLDEALAEAQAAKKLDAKRFEAYATTALILHAQQRSAAAKIDSSGPDVGEGYYKYAVKKSILAESEVEQARKLVPADRKEEVEAIAKLVLESGGTTGAQGSNKPVSSKYEDHLQRARTLLKENKLLEALAEAQAASKLNPKGYEAPAAGAIILLAAKRPAQAKEAIEQALKLAPPDKQEKLQEIARLVGAGTRAKASTVPVNPGPAPPPKLSSAARRQMEVLMLITAEADKARLADERNRLLREFMDKSEPFVKEHPDVLSIWMVRGVAALELNQALVGWDAGQNLMRLGATNSPNRSMRAVLALMEQRQWLTPERPVKLHLSNELSRIRKNASQDTAGIREDYRQKNAHAAAELRQTAGAVQGFEAAAGHLNDQLVSEALQTAQAIGKSGGELLQSAQSPPSHQPPSQAEVLKVETDALTRLLQ